MRAYRGAVDAGDLEGGLQLAFLLREQGERRPGDGRRHGDRRRGRPGGRRRRRLLALVRDARPVARGRPARRGRPLPGRPRPTSPTCSGRPDARTRPAPCWSAAPSSASSRLAAARQLLPPRRCGDDEAAEEAYRGGIAAGETYCHHNLAVLLAERGDLDGAVEQFRLGAAAGDQLAAQTPSGSSNSTAEPRATMRHSGPGERVVAGADMSPSHGGRILRPCPKPPSTSPTSAAPAGRRAGGPRRRRPAARRHPPAGPRPRRGDRRAGRRRRARPGRVHPRRGVQDPPVGGRPRGAGRPAGRARHPLGQPRHPRVQPLLAAGQPRRGHPPRAAPPLPPARGLAAAEGQPRGHLRSCSTQADLDADVVARELAGALVCPVVTAHPTEVRRKTISQVQRADHRADPPARPRRGRRDRRRRSGRASCGARC